MPNYCENDLRVEIPYGLKVNEKKIAEKQFKDFKKLLNKKDGLKLDFNDFIPYPKKFKDLDDKAEKHNAKQKDWRTHIKGGFNQGGYEWCNSNWNTKWNANKVTLNESVDKEFNISFDTAWSPPKPIIVAMSKKFPSLEFDMRSFECGCEFNCRLRCVNGEIKVEKTGDYFGNRGG
jgi:hypothetical protein